MQLQGGGKREASRQLKRNDLATTYTVIGVHEVTFVMELRTTSTFATAVSVFW